MTAEEFVEQLQFSRYYTGCRQLIFALKMAVENPRLVAHVYRDLYGPVARQTGCTDKNVEKNIRVVLRSTWNRKKPSTAALFKALTGNAYATCPTNKEFIDTAVAFLNT